MGTSGFQVRDPSEHGAPPECDTGTIEILQVFAGPGLRACALPCSFSTSGRCSSSDRRHQVYAAAVDGG